MDGKARKTRIWGGVDHSLGSRVDPRFSTNRLNHQAYVAAKDDAPGDTVLPCPDS